MKEAHRLLTLQTGRDFGYDLAAWHHFLLYHPRLSKEYKYPSTWKAVRRRMNELFDDPDRSRLVRLLEEEALDTAGG